MSHYGCRGACVLHSSPSGHPHFSPHTRTTQHLYNSHKLNRVQTAAELHRLLHPLAKDAEAAEPELGEYAPNGRPMSAVKVAAKEAEAPDVSIVADATKSSVELAPARADILMRTAPKQDHERAAAAAAATTAHEPARTSKPGHNRVKTRFQIAAGWSLRGCTCANHFAPRCAASRTT